MDKRKIQLQSILTPSLNVCGIAEMYYHEEEDYIKFNGYFNLFYIEKRKKYTTIGQLYLEVKSYGCSKIIVMHDNNQIYEMTLDPDSEQKYEIELPYNKFSSGYFWFTLEKASTCREYSVDGQYIGLVDASKFRKVNVGIDICTYKREHYITDNLKKITRRILSNPDLEVSKHIHVYVIDNGNTLETYMPIKAIVENWEEKIKIFPNKNAGGAGGFTRGMLEALDDKKTCLTHLLLMDDDAVIEPDTLVRIYGFLTTLREEWKDIIIGGTMMREEYPYMLYCAGEKWKNGSIIQPEHFIDLREYDNASSASFMETGHEYERYSGWWCCCMSMNIIREDNLPIPLFIHYDDIEYGTRNKDKGIVFLNGIGVWHKGWELACSGSNLYYDIRNALIYISLHGGKHKKRIAQKVVLKHMIVALMRYKYKDVELIYRAVHDYMNGPRWLYEQDPEQLNNEIRGMLEKLVPVEELRDKFTEEELKDILDQADRYMKDLSIDTILNREKENKQGIVKNLSLNGWLLPVKKPDHVNVFFTTDSLYKVYRKSPVVLFEPSSKKAMILKKSYISLIKTLAVQIKTMTLLTINFRRCANNYSKEIPDITTASAWKEYLSR